MAMAKVIPCLDGTVERYPDEEITFPKWNGEVMSVNQFVSNYLLQDESFSVDAIRLIISAITSARTMLATDVERRKFLYDFLNRSGKKVDESIIDRIVW